MYSSYFPYLSLILIFIQTYRPLSSLPQHICIIDAGSSGYQINFYDIIRTRYHTSYIEKSKITFKKVYHPITEHIDNPLRLQASLKHLTTTINNALHKNNIHLNTVIVSVIGTAGYRKAQYKVNYESFICSIERSLSLYNYYKHSVQTISGFMEGYLLLKSVFYTESNFLNEIHTYGAWEIGGSSLQISILLPSSLLKEYKNQNFEQVVKNENCNVFKVPDYYFNFVDLNIFACSFEEMGVNDIQLEVNKHLVSNKDKGPYKNHCVNKGVFYTFKIKSEEYEILGDFERNKCKELLQKVLDPIIEQRESEIYYISMLNEVLSKSLKKPHIHVLPVSNLEHIINHLDVKDSKHLLRDLQEKSEKFCLKPFKEVLKEYRHLNEVVLKQMCINSNYVIALLEAFYNMDVNIENVLRFKETEGLKEKGVGWSLGAAYRYLLEYLFI